MLRNILYPGRDVTVVAVGLPASGPTFVTFSAMEADSADRVDMTGFGEKFFAQAEIPCLHVISHRNHWWQTDEMNAALAAGLPAIAASSRRVGYGSSMCGYAALRFSDALQLDMVLAFAPQFSVSPKIVPWEKHWPKERAQLQFQTERPMRAECEYCVFHDPNSADKRHVDLIASVVRLRQIVLHGPGHFVLKALSDAQILRGLLIGIHQGALGPDDISGYVEQQMVRLTKAPA